MEFLIWLGVGVGCAYVISNKLYSEKPEALEEIILPPPKRPNVERDFIFDRGSSLEFTDIEEGGVDQWGTPYSYGYIQNGAKVKLYGTVEHLRSVYFRIPKSNPKKAPRNKTVEARLRGNTDLRIEKQNNLNAPNIGDHNY